MTAYAARIFAPMKLTMSQRVDRRREELGMSITTLAERIGFSRNRLSEQLGKDGVLDLNRLPRICEVLEHNFFSYLAEEMDRKLGKPRMMLLREPEGPGYRVARRTLVPIQTQVDASDPEEQAAALEFAEKLRRIQEAKEKR